jgi:hypothetical protein
VVMKQAAAKMQRPTMQARAIRPPSVKSTSKMARGWRCFEIVFGNSESWCYWGKGSWQSVMQAAFA